MHAVCVCVCSRVESRIVLSCNEKKQSTEEGLLYCLL